MDSGNWPSARTTTARPNHPVTRYILRSFKSTLLFLHKTRSSAEDLSSEPRTTSFGVLTSCSWVRHGTRGSGAPPARIRRAAHPCEPAGAVSRPVLGASKPSARAPGDPPRLLPDAPPRDDRDAG